MIINKALNRKLKKLDISKKEFIELKNQLLDNADELKEEFLKEGLSEEEAEKKVLESIELDELIKSFKENSIKKYFLSNKIIVISLTIIFSLFILKCTTFTAPNRGNLSDFAYIPFRFLFNLIININNYHAWHDAFILDQIFILLLFVVFGTLIPIILNKWNSLIPNLKIYIFFNVIVALLSKIRFFNFDLTILRILACILGFYIFKYLIKKLGD